MRARTGAFAALVTLLLAAGASLTLTVALLSHNGAIGLAPSHAAHQPKQSLTPKRTPTLDGMWVGIGNGGSGSYSSMGPDLKGIVSYVRMDTDSASDVALWASAGIKIINDISGDIGVPGYGSGGQQHYDTGGVSAINATDWANNAVNWYSGLPSSSKVDVVAIEVLNEPYGAWFWGPNARSETNAAAYVNLLKTVHAAFLAAFPAGNYPLLLASWGRSTWGREVWGSHPALVNSYINGVVVHPYGGTTDNLADSALVSKDVVTAAHSATGEPVYVTEVGWPTAVGQPGAGASMQFSEQAQAENIYNFVNWARNTGYVNAVITYSFLDSGGNQLYGIVRHDDPAGPNGSLKPSYYALQEAAHGLPLTCSGC
jgi:hypothetical protein